MSDADAFWLEHRARREAMSVPDVIEAHMESIHDDRDDGCVCPPCLREHRLRSEELIELLGRREEQAGLLE